eukprot:7201100-Prymnesium_polylepis.2
MTMCQRHRRASQSKRRSRPSAALWQQARPAAHGSEGRCEVRAVRSAAALGRRAARCTASASLSARDRTLASRHASVLATSARRASASAFASRCAAASPRALCRAAASSRAAVLASRCASASCSAASFRALA